MGQRVLKTLEVATVDFRAGGGAIRAYNMLIRRAKTGIACNSMLIGEYDKISPDIIKSCKPVGFFSHRAGLPPPRSFFMSLMPLSMVFARSVGGEKIDADLVISHHENIDSIRISTRIAEQLGSKKLAILQLPPVYGNPERLNNFIASVYMLRYLTFMRRIDIIDVIGDIYAKGIWRRWYHIFSKIVERHLLEFDIIVTASPSIAFEMGEPWMERIISLQPGFGFEPQEISFLRQLRRRPGEPRASAVFPARLIPQKGIVDLLLATRLIKRERPNFRLLVMGSGDSRTRRRIQRIVDVLGIRDNVAILDYVPRQESFLLRRTARLTLYPSHVDSYSYTVAESLLMGVPVVAYDIPALRVNFGGLRGLFLVKEFDIETMAQRVLEVLEMRDVAVEEPKVKTYDQIAMEEKIIIEKAIQG